MSELTPDDVRQWDVAIIQQIFDAAAGLHGTHQRLGEDLSEARQRTADWQGEGGDAFRADLGKTLAGVQADGDQAQRVAAAAQRAEGDVGWCRGAIDVIDETAAANGWTVTPDWRIDTSLANAAGRNADPAPLQTQLDEVNARAHQADHELGVAVRAAVGETTLDADGNEVPARLVSDGEKTGDDDPDNPDQPPGEPPPEPTIDGAATDPVMDPYNTGQQDDLDSSIPGTDIALGGDGKEGYPRVDIPGHNGDYNPLSPNGLPVPNGEVRPLPTGTAVGPNGEQLGFYGLVPYFNPDGSPNLSYSVPDTVVVDLAHPDRVLYTLHGISQASGAYDAQTGRMVIMGNTLDGNRALWESAPVSQNSAWGDTLQPRGVFDGWMNGNRESQLVALPRGGFMAVGAADGQPIRGVVAGTPEGLLRAAPTSLVPQMPDGQFPYGPTITAIDQVGGKEVVRMRLSTFGIGGYDPRTYTSTFTVTP